MTHREEKPTHQSRVDKLVREKGHVSDQITKRIANSKYAMIGI